MANEMVERPASRTVKKSGGRGFTAASFRVPRHYLDILVGPDAAAALLAGAASAAFPAGGDTLPSMLFLNLCLEHMRRTDDESYGVAGTRVARGTFGLMIAAAAQGDTFGEALQRFAMAAPLLRPDTRVQFTRSRRGLMLSLDYAGERGPRRDLTNEIFALTAHCGFRWLTGRKVRVASVERGPVTAPLGPSLVWPVLGGTLVRRGSGVTFVYSLADADVPILPVKYQQWATHELGEFTQLLDEAAREMETAHDQPAPDIVRQVEAVIGPDAWGEKAAARALGMSTATLRRRLAEAGVSFRGLSGEARRRAALSLLATEHPLEEVAGRLGFSDARSLRRACHGWFGMAPAAFRKLAR